MPDKLIDKDLLSYYDSKLKTQANILQRNTSYILGQFVYRGNIFLRCTTAGTTATTALNLTGVSIGDNLTDGTCGWVVFDPFDGVNAWQSNKQYALYDLAVEDEDLYLCISSHTSSNDFQYDLNVGYWKKISGSDSESGSGSGGEWEQVTKMNVVAPSDVFINIPYTNKFKRPPVEVLKYEHGLNDNTTNVLNFSAGDGSKFKVDGITASESPLVTFDEVAKPNHEILYPFGTAVQMDSKYYTESEIIDFSDYKLVEEVGLE